MLSYEKNFSPRRSDGRFVSTMAAHMEFLRRLKPELALPEELTRESFVCYQDRVKEKLRELLGMPEFTPQPPPVRLWREERDGYRLEKWEFYPDDYAAVPFLVLIPEGASAAHPVPGVLCLPGSNHSKESLAGEPLPPHPEWPQNRFPERNAQALHMVRNGMAAFAFDNPAIGECALHAAPEFGELQGMTRVQMCHGLLDSGACYVGLATFQKLCFLEHLERFDFVDPERIAITTHSRGTDTAIATGLLCNRIKAIVFNDFLHDDRRRYVSVTEEPEREMIQDIGNWHIIPGKMRYFAFQDLCAAFAPRYLALTEGGAEEFLSVVERAYRVCGASDHLQITFYPAYADPATRTMHEPVPLFGLSKADYYTKYSYVVVPDHSFRAEPALKLLKRCFGLEQSRA